ncbi:unnamed protein product [Sphacelaria rigidula]
MKCEGEGVVTMLLSIYNWIWESESTPKTWGEGAVVNYFKRGDKVGPGNCKGITLLGTVRKQFLNTFEG